MDKRYRNYKWADTENLNHLEFTECDFSGSDFNNVYFVSSIFRGCLFQRGKPGNLAFFSSSFSNCTFNNFDFRRVIVGADGGLFEDCQFLHCNFGGQHFESPHFDGCSFESCKIQGVNFNDSSFRECRFIGVIEDTTFNGLYHKKPTGFKILDRVDFSQTVFGDFVTFEDCDLPTCIPPLGKTFDDLLYPIYRDNPKVLSTGTPDRIVLDLS